MTAELAGRLGTIRHRVSVVLEALRTDRINLTQHAASWEDVGDLLQIVDQQERELRTLRDRACLKAGI